MHERVYQGEKVKGTKKKKVKGWSTEEMKDKANSFFWSKTEEMRTLEIFEPRGDGSMLEEVGGKNGGGSSGQVQGRGQQKRGLQRQRLPVGMEAGTKKQHIKDTQVERRLLGKNLRLVQRIQSAASAKHG